jgi:phosphohistidine phosphatase
MMHVYLVQHGRAFLKEEDPERRLTEEGVKETKVMAKYLKKIGVRMDQISHSGKIRAIETARIFGEILEISDVREEKGLAPSDDPKDWYDKLMRRDSDIMIVSHLPYLSKLTSMLLGIDTEVIIFRHSGVLCLEKGEDLKWRIKWYVTPDTLPG